MTMMRPRPLNTSVRPPAVAGFFYPDDPAELRDMVTALIAQTTVPAMPSALSYIVPHAGYVYSGPVAASAYAHLRASGQQPRRIVIIGPSHRVYLRGIAVSQAHAFRTPLGVVPIDLDARRQLEERGDVLIADEPHANEHSLEVQLPFLQILFDDFELVPLVVGEARADQVAPVLELLAQDSTTLVLASSDLSHYLRYEDAQRVDADTNARILRFADTLAGEQACGAVALNGLLRLAKQRGAAITTLALMNSGDTAGDRSRVVGYGAYAIDDHRARRAN